MPEEKDKKTRNAGETSAIDRQVLDAIREEKRKGSRRGPKDAEAERNKRKLAENGLRAIKNKDVRVFTELLRKAGVREGSPEWKNAWKAFYSA